MAAWGAESGHIDVTVREAVAVVTLRRPERLNALTADMRRELAAILRYFGAAGAVRGIVLTGTGRAFSAGEDLSAAARLPPGGLVTEAELIGTAIQIVHRWTRPSAPSAAHLRLLRPPLEMVEQAMAAETEAARETEEAGIARRDRPVPQPAPRRHEPPAQTVRAPVIARPAGGEDQVPLARHDGQRATGRPRGQLPGHHDRGVAVLLTVPDEGLGPDLAGVESPPGGQDRYLICPHGQRRGLETERPAMVTTVKRPAGGNPGKWLQDLTPDNATAPAPRPYSVWSSG